MPEEYREYRNRRRPNQKSHSKPPKHGYIKKLLKQALLSLLILGTILAPNLLGPGVSAKVKSIAKSALSYTVDTSKITKALESLLKIPANHTDQGEPQNDETKNPEKNI
jgi:hypothetical protein